MRIGIVGSEAKKFTSETEEMARTVIRSLISPSDTVVSGKCHLGGIDIWAVEEAIKIGAGYKEYPPKRFTWEGGYKQRNMQIVNNSDRVVCITVKRFPPNYDGMRFAYCYHCHTDEHIKSGGCWTVKQAKLKGKVAFVVVIDDLKESK